MCPSRTCLLHYKSCTHPTQPHSTSPPFYVPTFILNPHIKSVHHLIIDLCTPPPQAPSRALAVVNPRYLEYLHTDAVLNAFPAQPACRSSPGASYDPYGQYSSPGQRHLLIATCMRGTDSMTSGQHLCRHRPRPHTLSAGATFQSTKTAQGSKKAASYRCLG